MRVGIDIDGTIDSFPRQFQSMISAFAAQGDQVYIITGIDVAGPVQQSDIDAKRTYLASIGITMYTDLILVPQDPDGGHAQGKAQVIQQNAIDLLIDNDKKNIKAAVAIGAIGLLVWNSKQS